MDKTVPPGAAMLLAFIAEIETGKPFPECYDVLYAHKKWAMPITMLTVDEWIAAGPTWTRKHGSSAAGAYQFMNATLKGLKGELQLNGNQVMNGNLQDRLGYHLLKRRGYEAFIAGRITRTAFGKALAQEWASLPVLGTTKGRHKQVARGQSYYAGDSINKSLVQPHRVEAVLDAVLAATQAAPAPGPLPTPPAPVSPPQPEPTGQGKGFGLIAIVLIICSVAAGIWQWLSSLFS